MAHWKVEKGKAGRPFIRLEGNVSGAEAAKLAQAIRELSHFGKHSIELEVSRSRGSMAVLTARIFELLSQDSPRPEVHLTGVSRHLGRLLDYMGLHDSWPHEAVS